MSMELTLLRLSTNKERFKRLLPDIPQEGMENTTLMLVHALAAFYEAFPDVVDIDVPSFVDWLESVRLVKTPPDRRELCLEVARRMAQKVPQEMAQGLMEKLLELEFRNKLLDGLRKYDDGGDIDIIEFANDQVRHHQTRMNRKVRTPLVEGTPEDLGQEDLDGSGIRFRLSCLHDNMRGLRGGDFGIMAARPDAGKTTLLCSETAHWLTQLDAYWPGQKRNGIWLNNEGPGRRIKSRWFQAVLGMTSQQVSELIERGRDEGRPLFTEALNNALGMDYRRMKFYDIHGMNHMEVKRLLDVSNPGFVVYDMMDNITFKGMSLAGGARTDQILEAQYQTGREWCVELDCIGVATSQLDVNGENNRHPGQHMLKDSKVGKQGACDFIITMGKDNDPIYQNSRWINTPKNKLVMPGKRTDPRAEVVFSGDRCRVEDPQAA